MRGSDLTEDMTWTMDRIVSAREGTGAVDRAIEAVVGTIGRFGEKNTTRYLEAYRAEMIMRDILVDRWLSRFPRVVTNRACTQRCSRCWPDAKLGRSSSCGSSRSMGSTTRFDSRSETSWRGLRSLGRGGTRRRSSGVRKTVCTVVDVGPDRARHKPGTTICEVGGRSGRGEGESPVGNR